MYLMRRYTKYVEAFGFRWKAKQARFLSRIKTSVSLTIHSKPTISKFTLNTYCNCGIPDQKRYSRN